VEIRSRSAATDLVGRSTASVSTTGEAGVAVVRAEFDGLHADVLLVLELGAAEVVLDPNGMSASFRSSQNRSVPAMDTLVVGESMEWRLDPFDYDNHELAFLESMAPATGSWVFPYANPSVVRIAFNAPGVYRYRDVHSEATGTVLVRERSVP
jgi:plastocyanin